MRNRLIHAYFDIDHDVLWKAAMKRSRAVDRVARHLAKRLIATRECASVLPHARETKIKGGGPFFGPAALIGPRI